MLFHIRCPRVEEQFACLILDGSQLIRTDQNQLCSAQNCLVLAKVHLTVVILCFLQHPAFQDES